MNSQANFVEAGLLSSEWQCHEDQTESIKTIFALTFSTLVLGLNLKQ